MAILTTAMYVESRSHERKVRSFAQWSRASEASLMKRRGAKGLVMSRFFGCLETIRREAQRLQ